MNQDIQLETKLIKEFFAKEKQSRFLEFIKTEKNRKKFVSELNKNNILNENLFEKVDGNEYEIIHSKIKNIKTLNKCYVISELENIDARTMEIEKALTEIISSDAESIIIFGNCEVIYIEKEGFNNRLISKSNL